MTLSAYWQFNETTGSFFDSSGYENTGIPTDITRGFRSAYPDDGTSIRFNGSTSKIDVTNFTGLKDGVFSFETWFKLDSALSDGTYNIFECDNGSIVSVSLSVINITGSNKLEFGWYYDSTLNTSSTDALEIELDTWHHLGLLFNESTAAFFIDGEYADDIDVNKIEIITTGLTVSASGSPFDGHLDHMAFYTNLVPVDTFASRYRLSNLYTDYDAHIRYMSPILYFRLQDYTEDIMNVSTTENGTIVTGASTEFFDERTGMEFGSGDYITVDDSDYGNFGSSALFASVWVKTTTDDATKRVLFGKGGVAEQGWVVYLLNGIPYVYLNDGTNTDDLSSSTSIDDGEWHFVAFKADLTDLTIFIDGQQVATQPQTATLGLNNSNELSIGAEYDGGQDFLGTMHSVMISNEDLLDSSINNLWTVGFDGIYNLESSTDTISITNENYNHYSYDWETHLV
jgi:hypothetical protein